jgi:hypothetical protein
MKITRYIWPKSACTCMPSVNSKYVQQQNNTISSCVCICSGIRNLYCTRKQPEIPRWLCSSAIWIFTYVQFYFRMIGAIIYGHVRRCPAGSVSCAHSFTNSTHHSDSRNYKLMPLIVFKSAGIYTFPILRTFNIYSKLQERNPANNESLISDVTLNALGNVIFHLAIYVRYI